VKELQCIDIFNYEFRLTLVGLLSDPKWLLEKFIIVSYTDLRRSDAQGCYTKVYFSFKKLQHSIFWQEEMSVLQSSEKQDPLFRQAAGTEHLYTYYFFPLPQCVAVRPSPLPVETRFRSAYVKIYKNGQKYRHSYKLYPPPSRDIHSSAPQYCTISISHFLYFRHT
jgi:hypothetical protein